MHPARCLPSSGARLLLLLVVFSAFTSLAIASTPTSFCKCTCFSNSTIIPLDPGSGSVDSVFDGARQLFDRAFDTPDAHDDREDGETAKRAESYRGRTCNDCNRKFCLAYDLPTCKGAKEDDVFTTCFQRDSRKDEAVVFIFIFATGALLAWALFKPWIERYIETARERRSYMPVAEPE
ncbi:hypothetical protein N7492_003621 [Penicillium capsulatum]|uniref:Uncharacterized protein n=1 Tax=Penicillium capsulatum TaxID=69766 RepID=A0A9W9INF0_9EURO|nr:hypothetical protein N7492_003621 [Penicillium capsulatum]